MSYEGHLYIQPTVNTFTNLNFITGTTTSKVSGNTLLYVPGAAGTNLVGQYIAAPATPYCVIAKLVSNQGDYVSSSYTLEPIMYGIGFYDGTKLVWVRSAWSSTSSLGLFVTECSSTSSLTTNVFGQSFADGQTTGSISWFQIRDDGTNIYFYVAMDDGETQPTHWVKLYQQARTSYLANVNNVCWLCNSNASASGPPTYLTLQSWQTVAL